MKTIKRTLFAVLAISATVLAALPAAAADWQLDQAHSSVGFSIRHMTVSKVKGSFNAFEGTVTGDPAVPTSLAVEVVIQVASIDTGNRDRDDHLLNPDFFDAATYPTITFRSTGVTMDGSEGKLKGELTMHGVTKPVELDLEYAGVMDDPWGYRRAGFSASGTIDRQDFGLTYNKALETGGLVLGNDVAVAIEVELVQAK
ncbi:MAG TPA: YceI family protein [Candidatus Krumholzibacteria bacterium]|nr:YceI family protein [Candidatus Krumholzibacteria bacterium]